MLEPQDNLDNLSNRDTPDILVDCPSSMIIEGEFFITWMILTRWFLPYSVRDLLL